MLVASIVVLLVMLLLSVGTLTAFTWAASKGEFQETEAAARSIFDADEPIGEPTDSDLLPSHDEHLRSADRTD